MPNSEKRHDVEDSELLNRFKLSTQTVETKQFGKDEHFELVIKQTGQNGNYDIAAVVAF
jgi:hypothetical protein